MTLAVKDVAARMRKVEDATKKGTRGTVVAAAMKAKIVISSGAPSRLRGVGRAGAKLGVRYTIRGSEMNPSAQLRATGPWQLIEKDTKPHRIGPKKRRGGSRSGRGGGVAVPGVGVFRSVHHPGTKGKHPWAKGVEKAEPVVAREMGQKTANIVKAAFGG